MVGLASSTPGVSGCGVVTGTSLPSTASHLLSGAARAPSRPLATVGRSARENDSDFFRRPRLGFAFCDSSSLSVASDTESCLVTNRRLRGRVAEGQANLLRATARSRLIVEIEGEWPIVNCSSSGPCR